MRVFTLRAMIIPPSYGEFKVSIGGKTKKEHINRLGRRRNPENEIAAPSQLKARQSQAV